MDHDSMQLMPLLRQAGSVLITTHAYPDGDAAGSMLGLTRALRNRGARVDMAISTEIGERFEFMFEGEEVLKPDQVSGPYELVIILDIGSEDRTGFQEIIRSLKTPILNIDHHATNEGFGDIDIIDTSASSTCELVYQLIKAAGLECSRSVAEGLYLGIVTDSRFFQNSNVTADTFAAASELMRTGIDHQKILRRLTQSRSPADLKVLGIGLNRFRSLASGRIAMTQLFQSDFQQLNTSYRQAWSAGVFNYLISLDTALVAICFIEAEDGIVYCEFRSKDGVDVASIAAHFGGGGHRSASGCSVRRAINDFTDEVLDYVNNVITAV